MGLEPTNETLRGIVYFACSFSIIAAPCFMYFHQVFLKHWESIMVEKRHPEILQFQAFVSVTFFAIGYPLMVADFAQLDDFDEATQTVISCLNRVLYPMFGPYAIFTCIAWRFWHIFYDLKYNSSQKNSEWKFYLDPNLVENNFWLNHKATLGSVQWTQKRLAIYYIITCILPIYPYQMPLFDSSESAQDHILYAHAITVFINGICVAMIFILWLKIPQYSDNFFVKKELQMIAVGSVISVPFSIAAVAYGMLSSPALLIVVMISLVTLLFFMASLYSFWYIPRKIRREEQEIQLAKLVARQKSESSSNSPHVTTTSTLNRNVNQPQMGGIVRRLSQLSSSYLSYRLHAVLSHPQSFKLFMQHLGKEFSTECLLCFTEVVQYKFELSERIRIVDGLKLTVNPGFVDRCPLSEVTPMSAIVRQGFEAVRTYNADDDPTHLTFEAKNVVYQIYKKYIAVGSELEVNISYSMRARLNGLMSSRRFWYSLAITTDDLFSTYDDVAEQMYRLMDGAFVRFRQKDVWKTVKRILRDTHNAFQSNQKAVDTLPAIADK